MTTAEIKRIIVADAKRPDLFQTDSSHLSSDFPDRYAEKGDIFIFVSENKADKKGKNGKEKQTEKSKKESLEKWNRAITEKLEKSEISYRQYIADNGADMSDGIYSTIREILEEDSKSTYIIYLIALKDNIAQSVCAKLELYTKAVCICNDTEQLRKDLRKKKKEENTQKEAEAKEERRKKEDGKASSPKHDFTKGRHYGMISKPKSSNEETPLDSSSFSQNKNKTENTYYSREPEKGAPEEETEKPKGDMPKENSHPVSRVPEAPKRTKSPPVDAEKQPSTQDLDRRRIESAIAENNIPTAEKYSDSIGDVELAKIDYAKKIFLKIRDTLEGAVKGLKDLQLDDSVMEKYIAVIALSDGITDFRDMWTTLEPGLQTAAEIQDKDFAKIKEVCEYYKKTCDLFESRAAKALD